MVGSLTKTHPCFEVNMPARIAGMPEPLTVGAALTTAGGGVSLINNIITFVRNVEKAKQDPRLADVLARIPAEAFSLAGQYVQQVQELRQALVNTGIDPGKTQREAFADTWRLQFRRRGLLTKFTANINAIETQLSRLLDDIVAVADCCGDDDFVINSFAAAEELRTVIHRETDPARTLGEILDSLEGRAQDMRTALGDMKR